jgi:hypothetical protein
MKAKVKAMNRYVLLAVIAVLILPCLAGCGGGGSVANNTTGPVTKAEEVEPNADQYPSGDIVISYKRTGIPSQNKPSP